MDFVGKRKIFYILSAVILLVSIVFMIPAGPMGLKWGIEFTSGSTMTMQFDQSISQDDLTSAMVELGHGEAKVKEVVGQEGSSGSTFFVRTKKLVDHVQGSDTGTTVPEQQKIKDALIVKFGTMDITESYDIDSTMAKGIASKAVIAVILASIGILLYIAWAFRKMKHAFRLGVCAIIALLHDAVICIGVYAIMGTFFVVEVDAMFITAILTVIGYSVNDTIVVYDRIRENSLKNPGLPLGTVINNSIMETISRSINTSMTVVFVLLSLYLIGGPSIHNFVLVLLVGVIVGTYSSIFIASQLLLDWEGGRVGRIFGRLSLRRRAQPKVSGVQS
jgi:preprotein translocase subunit SecF